MYICSFVAFVILCLRLIHAKSHSVISTFRKQLDAALRMVASSIVCFIRSITRCIFLIISTSVISLINQQLMTQTAVSISIPL